MNKLYYTLLLFLLSIPFSFAQDNNCDHPDFPTLVALNNAISGLNWDITDCDVCNYEGISCDANNRVFSIRRPNSNLSGSLPKEIGNLIEIRILVLDDNQLSGRIPKELGNLVNIIILDLSGTQLSGNIPKEVSLSLIHI